MEVVGLPLRAMSIAQFETIKQSHVLKLAVFSYLLTALSAFTIAS